MLYSERQDVKKFVYFSVMKYSGFILAAMAPYVFKKTLLSLIITVTDNNYFTFLAPKGYPAILQITFASFSPKPSSQMPPKL